MKYMQISKSFYKYSFFIILTLASQKILAQDVRVHARLDTSIIETGDQIWLYLQAELNKNDKILFPIFRDSIVKDIEILEISGIDTQFVEGSKIRLNQQYLLTSFDVNFHVIPPVPFKHGNDTLYTEALVLNVIPVELDSAEKARIDTTQVFQVFDVKPPINTPWTIKEFLQLYYPYLLSFLGLIAIIVLVYIYLNRRAKNRPLIQLPQKPKEPAHIIAFRALEALKAKKLWQSGFEKEYYLELTDIIREYLEARYHISTFERTSQEILENLSMLKLLETSIFTELNHLLTLADLAKFAKYKPLPNENDSCLSNAFEFVEKTKQEPVLNTGEEKHPIEDETKL